MKHIIALWLVALMFVVQPVQAAVCIGFGQTGGGGGTAFSSGAIESFESGEGLFDTTGVTETDNNSSITTYDTTFSRCGTHNLKVVTTSTNNTDKVVFDMGAGDSDFYFTVYISALSTMGQYESLPIIFSENSDGTNVTASLYMKNGASFPSNIGTFQHVESYYEGRFNTEAITNGYFRIEMHIVANGTSSYKVAHWDGSSWTQLTSGYSNLIETFTAANYVPRYITFTSKAREFSSTIYFDSLKITQGSYSGDITCP